MHLGGHLPPGRRGVGVGGGAGGRGCCPTPGPTSPPLATLQPATNFFCSWHGDHMAEAEAEGAGTPARPPCSPGTGGGTTASPCYGGGTARLTRCSPPPTSGEDGPAPPVPSPPSKGCALGSSASRTSSPGRGMGGGTPTTSARTAPSSCRLSGAPLAPSLGPRGPPSARRCNGGTPASSLRTPPNDRSAGLFYTWRWYLAPLWQEETGAPMWRPTCHGRVEHWDPPNYCWHVPESGETPWSLLHALPFLLCSPLPCYIPR